MKRIIALISLSLFVLSCSTERYEHARKTLFYGLPQDPLSLDPAEATDFMYVQIAFNIFETLLRYDWEKSQFIPALATSWDASPDSLVWTFHLRPGVIFHDGSTFDAHAVKVSFDRQIDAASPFYREGVTDTYGQFALNMIEAIKITDDLTVQFKLKFPYASFLENLATSYFASIVSPAALKKYGLEFARHPVGTGPFQFTGWEKGKKIVLKRFERYWGKSPGIDEVIYKIVSSIEEKIKGLRVGKLDIITGLSAASVSKLYHDPKIKVVTQQSPATTFLSFNCQIKPLSNPKVRRAISLALDVKSMVSFISRGLAEVAQGPISPGVFSYDSLIRQEGYNLEKARELMRKAGYPNGFQTRLHYFIYTDTLRADPFVQSIKSQLEKIDVKIELIPYTDWSTLERKALEGQQSGMIWAGGWPAHNLNPDNFFYPLFHSQSPLNFFNYSNPQLDRLLEEARTTPDKSKRRRLYHQIQHIIIKETPAVFISYPKLVYAINPRVKNFHVGPNMIVRLSEIVSASKDAH